MIRVTEIKLPIGHTDGDLLKKTAKALRVPQHVVKKVNVFKRSLDARKKEDIHYVYVVDAEVDNEKQILEKAQGRTVSSSPDLRYVLPTGTAKNEKRPVVVGFGPAGMFCALLLAQMGMRPIVLERGADVETRKEDISRFWAEGKLNPESNVQFGEGGAGTFSDGKLTTRIKDPRCRKVLEEMVAAGAPKEILFDAKPHIGTDLLQPMVKKVREEIIRLGGEVRFFSKVVDIETGKNKSVILQNGEEIETDDIVLALGHSARDTFEMLYQKGFVLEQKPFAMGVRIEHMQEWIDKAQYGEQSRNLPSADYKLTYTTKKGRGVYTFCMCPGGYVVAAASEEGRLAINGMSEYARDAKNANSALLVQVFPEDFEDDHPLSGMHLQRKIEEKAFVVGGGGYQAPTQTVGSFLGKGGANGIAPSYQPSTKRSDLHEVLPAFMTEALEEAIPAMGRKLKGFDRKDAVLTAVESRSSSPVRIARTMDLECTMVQGVYPIGEGAGYAGGIVSAAVDGILAAEKIFAKYAK